MAPHSFLGIALLASASTVLARVNNARLPSSHTTLQAVASAQITPSQSSSTAISVVVTTKEAQQTQAPGGSLPLLDYSFPAWNPLGWDLTPALTPQDQAGDSPLGTPNAPKYAGPLAGLIPDLPWGLSPPWLGNPPLTPGNSPSQGGAPAGGSILPGLNIPFLKDIPFFNNNPFAPAKGSSPSSPPTGSPGGSSDCVLIDPSKVPDTGMTRRYNFVISYQDIAPDGVTKQGLVINGGFPGPTIEANWGDWIEVTVKNTLEGSDNPEGNTIHWHGLLQKETPFMDGVPSVAQCPIVPGDSFTYRFRADQYGTSWYHSHYSAQYSAGVFGAMIIHGPNDTPQCAGYDEDLGPVLIGDWYHPKYYDLVEKVMSRNAATGGPPLSQSNLVNGRGNYPCQKTTDKCTPNAGLSKFKFESGKKYRLRLINPSSEALQKISIDGHKMKVIAHDWVPVVPYETDLITLGVGQRTDVIVEATGDKSSSYWLRSTLQANGQSCSLVDGINANATAVIYYEDASPNSVPTSKFDISADRILDCKGDSIATNGTPLFPLSSDPVGELFTQTFNIDFINNGTNQLWAMNNISARVDYDVSQLLEATQGTLHPQKQWNLYTLPQTAGTARIIMYNSFPFAGHPMHLHGHNFQVLAEGTGTWDGTITNPSNPLRRDVVYLQPADVSTGARGYSVIQYELDNPAIQVFHCHIAWHVSAGLYSALLEKPDDIRKRTVPDSIRDGCSKWATFTGSLILDQIDSGV